MRAWPCGKANPSWRSDAFWATAIPRRRSSIPIRPTRWSWMPPRRSAPCWGVKRWPARIAQGLPMPPSPASGRVNGNIRSGISACPVSGPGEADGRADLCPAAGHGRPFDACIPRFGRGENGGGDPPRSARPGGLFSTDRPGRARRDPTNRPVVPGFRRGSVERSPFRSLQAVDERGRAVRATQSTAANLRRETAGSDFPRGRQALVRYIQSHLPGWSQSQPRHPSPDHEFRRLAGPSRYQPGADHQAQSPAQAHPIPVSRGDRQPPPGARCPCGRESRAAGRHDQASSADRMQKKRDRTPALVGGA